MSDSIHDAWCFLLILLGLLLLLVVVIFPDVEHKTVSSLKQDYCVGLGGVPEHPSFSQFLMLNVNFVSCSFKKDNVWTTYEVVERNGVMGLE